MLKFAQSVEIQDLSAAGVIAATVLGLLIITKSQTSAALLLTGGL